MTEGQTPLPIVILISGDGSNLQAIIDAQQSGELPVEIRAVISNRPDAYGLVRAQQAGIATAVLDHRDYPSRKAFDHALQLEIDRHQPGLVVLAGFMRLLTSGFVNHYLGRMLNIHPSLLPEFKGLNTHQRALDAFRTGRIQQHGASVHFVTPDLDGGPVILQSPVTILDEDTVETLAARVLAKEHALYTRVIRWFAEGRLQLNSNQVWLNGKVLSTPLTLS